ncbi:hypothetical protein BASA50_000003 [Batrachochytrium salamandrivorans]|uniref:Uncharacterized protein n=1 Tax=Batrachochytrium salamandrivorans TaxID=1357716 RepID=A0ABQ8EUT4_9FUNG|nr:hypothetical protein BASA50_000003 [Batrachochytrium salamandrivorans]
MQSNTFNFNATFSFSLNLTVTPVTRGSPSGGPSAANIHLDGQFQFSASIRVNMDGPSVPNPEAWTSRWVVPTEPSCVRPISIVCESVKDHRSDFALCDIAHIAPISPVASVASVASISPVASVASISPVVPAVPAVVPIVPVVPAASIAPIIPFPPVLAAISAQNCAVGAILPVAMPTPVDTTPATPGTSATPASIASIASTPATPSTPASSPTTASTATVNPATPVAEPSWLKKAMRNDRPFWESPRRSSKRVIPPVRARVHPDSVPEDWATTYIDNEPRTFYYPAIRE